MVVSNKESLSRLFQRSFVIFTNAARRIAPSFFTLVLSYLVIHYASKEIWGSFVPLMVIVALLTQFSAYGSREFLLKEVSLKPSSIKHLWQENFISRLILLLPVTLFWLFYPCSLALKIALILWCLIRFIYQSFDFFIVFNRRFQLSLGLESIGFLITSFSILFYHKYLSLESLAFALLIGEGLKVFIALFLFYKDCFPFMSIKGGISKLKQSASFFLLGFSGMLHSRIDILCVSWYFDSTEVAKYQVIMSFLITLQACSDYILLPFIKIFYRIKEKHYLKVKNLHRLIGWIISVPAIIILYFIWNAMYGFIVSPYILVLSFFFVLSVYYYTPIIYFLFKHGKQRTVLWISLLGAFISLLANIGLIPNFRLEGALLAATLSQWITCAIYLRIMKVHSSITFP